MVQYLIGFRRVEFPNPKPQTVKWTPVDIVLGGDGLHEGKRGMGFLCSSTNGTVHNELIMQPHPELSGSRCGLSLVAR